MRLLKSCRGTPGELLSLGPQLRSVADSLLLCSGALQLLPDNATKWLRFARLVEATRAVRSGLPQRTATVAELEALLTGPPIASDHVLDHEDPFEGPFTAPILFSGTEYLTVPGAVADAATVCQFLLGALDELPTGVRAARELMRRDAVRLLWISDTVARRGGLERWQAPTYEKSRSVHIPAEADLKRLKAAVYIDTSDLQHQFGGIENFADLCWPEVRVRWRRERACLTDDRTLIYPLSRASSSNGLIVPAPNQLALSIVHRVAARAVAIGMHHHLMSAFRRAVLADAERICRQMDWMPLGSSLGLGPSGYVQDTVFAFDADKIAHLVVFADDLHGYETASPLSPTDSTAQVHRISKRMQQVRNAAGALDPESEVLHLVLTATIGRPMHADFSEFEGVGRSVLVLSLDELRTIANHERDDSLGLWRFARALNQIPLPGYPALTKAVDAYALYLQFDKRPRRLRVRNRPVVFLLVGYGASLVVDHQSHTDVHAARLPDDSGAVLVSREAATSTAPVYIPQCGDLGHLRLIELALPCWIGTYGADTRSQRNCAVVAQAVAHHLWRIRDIIDPHLEALAGYASRVVIDIVDLDESSLMLDDLGAPADTPWFEVAIDRVHCSITVRLLPNAAARLSNVSDCAESAFIADVARALALLANRPKGIEDADLDQLDPEAIPRFMYVGTGYVPGVHGGASLHGCRLKHAAELDAVTEEIDAIASGLGLEYGVVPAEGRVEVVEQIMRTLYSKLCSKLRKLSPDATFELLVLEQERMQQDRVKLRVVAPNSFTKDDYVVDAVKKFHTINQSAPAGRYLIETAVRHVQSGDRPLSLSLYDELLAICQQMTALGSIGDAYRYGLSDADMHFREPGQLSFDRGDPFHHAVNDYIEVNAHATVNLDLLAEWAKFTSSQDTVFDLDCSEMSAAFEAEFGVLLTKFCEGIGCLSELAACDDLHVRTMPVPDLLRDLTTTTELSESQAHKILDMISLRVESYDLEPDLFDLDFAPWRYARDRSFVRRPILIRECANKVSVAIWGTQALWTATEALFEQMFSGRLVTSSPQMKKYISQQRNRISRYFETEVADIFRRDPHNEVREQVKSLGNLSLERQGGNKIGDIDVLVVNEEQNTLWIIETKNFAPSRNAREIRGEIDKLISGENSAIYRHNERVKFVRDHWTTLHSQMQLRGHPHNWTIRDFVVTSVQPVGFDLLRRLGRESSTAVIPVEELMDLAIPSLSS